MLASSGVMPTYRKTDKGQAEIETRAFRLSPRLRTPLIMVDGRRNEDELRKLIPQPDETLQALLDQGFIEVVAAPAESRSSSESSSSSKHAAAATAAAEPAADLNALPLPMRFEDLRRQAVRSLIDQVGPAAEGVAMKMERTRNLQELRPLLSVARDILSTSSGSAAAATFAARFITPLRS
jgi:hypothetical protein